LLGNRRRERASRQMVTRNDYISSVPSGIGWKRAFPPWAKRSAPRFAAGGFCVCRTYSWGCNWRDNSQRGLAWVSRTGYDDLFAACDAAQSRWRSGYEWEIREGGIDQLLEGQDEADIDLLAGIDLEVDGDLNAQIDSDEMERTLQSSREEATTQHDDELEFRVDASQSQEQALQGPQSASSRADITRRKRDVIETFGCCDNLFRFS